MQYSTIPIYDFMNADYNCGHCNELHNMSVDLDYIAVCRKRKKENEFLFPIKDFILELRILQDFMRRKNSEKLQKEVDKTSKLGVGFVLPDVFACYN